MKPWLLLALVSLWPTQAAAQIAGRVAFFIDQPITYYVCAKAAGGTCVYNGDAGTVATPNDNGSCTTKAAPCATLAPIAAKLSMRILAATVTVQLADTAGTGTDCYRPNGTIFQLGALSTEIDTALSIAEANNTSGSYPSAYLYVVGNTTTPGNVIVTGATTCAGTTPNDLDGVKFGGNVPVRVRGFQCQYYAGGTNGPDNGCLEFYSTPNAFAEDLNYTGATSTSANLLTIWEGHLRMGNSVQGSITTGNVLDCLNVSHCSFVSPLGRANLTVTTGAWTAAGGLFVSNEGSHMAIDGLSLTVTGNATGAVTVWYAIASSHITYNDASTFSPAVAWGQTVNGANITFEKATQGSYINDICRTVSEETCSIGATTSISRYAAADTWAFINYSQAPTGATNGDTETSFGAVYSPTKKFFGLGSMTFTNLGTPANGTFTYCSDCTIANPCAGSGNGAFAKRLNGAWVCN